MPTRSSLPDHVHRHICAARAFHTGLVAETHRRLRLLAALASHLNVLRSRESTLVEKAAAAQSSRRHLDDLEELRLASLATHRDLRSALTRIYRHLQRLARGDRQRRLEREPRTSRVGPHGDGL
jgi:hypothetical protein